MITTTVVKKKPPPAPPEPREHEFGWNGDWCIHCGMSYSAIIASKRKLCFSDEAIRAGHVFARSVRT